MIHLEKVTKIYKSKNKIQITALNDLTLTFPNEGLVFVLGPSGCGKSTLLNLLGGLDTPTKGNIFVNDTQLEFKESSLDKYRNQYVGFIFQDYNLIHNLTVMDNLMLTCFEQGKDKAKKKIEEVLEQVGLKGYENRYPNELSGGQMQRIAIARALIKNSQIILADEPTGNLNSEMGHEVMEVFKQSAKEKLIIVVSHNEELANKYADRIIKMKDGSIISDTNPNLNNEKQNTNPCFKKSKLESKVIWKMAFKGLLKNKTDSILSILSLLLTFIALMVSFSFLNYNRLDVDVKNIPLMESNYFTLKYDDTQTYKVDYDTWSDKYDNSFTRKPEINLILQKYPNLTYNVNGYANKADDLKQMGVIFYDNYKEDVGDGIYISDKYLVSSIERGEIYYNEQGTIEVEKSAEYDYEQLIGTYLREVKNSILDDEYEYFEIRGIFHDYNEFGNGVVNGVSIYSNYGIFYKENGKYEQNRFNNAASVSIFSNEQNYDVMINDTKIDYGKTITYSIGSSTDVRFKKILTNYGIITCNNYQSNEIAVADDEIYISLSLYNEIYNEQSPIGYYIRETGFDIYTIDHYPTHLGENISTDLIYRYYSDYKLNLPSLKLKGVIMDRGDNVLLSSNNLYKLYKYDEVQNVLIYKNSIQDYRKFIKHLKDINLRPVYYPQYRFIIDWEEKNVTFLTLNPYLFAIFLSISILLFITFIRRTIKRDGKEIGILRSIGIKKNDILKIYLIEILLISFVILIPTWIVTYLSINILNDYFTSMLDYPFYILYYKWWYFFVVLIFIFVINYLSSFVSLIKLMKKKAINVIRQD